MNLKEIETRRGLERGGELGLQMVVVMRVNGGINATWKRVPARECAGSMGITCYQNIPKILHIGRLSQYFMQSDLYLGMIQKDVCRALHTCA